VLVQEHGCAAFLGTSRSVKRTVSWLLYSSYTLY